MSSASISSRSCCTPALTRDAIIQLHSGTIYTVYAIGFCPGFPYLGYLPDG